MIDKTLREELLQSELIIKGFVKGESKCNYENYLLEMVNKSSFFLEKSEGENFTSPQTESNGECDCNSKKYKMDFKLIASKTVLQARSILSPQKSIIAKGACITSLPQKEKSSINGTRLNTAIRGLSYEQLCELRNSAPKQQGIENDICDFLITLETKKNLLLFWPYRLKFDSKCNFDIGNKQIQEAISDDFKDTMQYRHLLSPLFDTYLAYIFDEYIVFMNENKSRFTIVDTIKLNESPTYMKLRDYIPVF